MSDIEERIRERAYLLWEEAGRPHGRSDEFWFAAWQELMGDSAPGEAGSGADRPSAVEPPEAASQFGEATGMPGERIAEQGVLDDRLAEAAVPAPSPPEPRADQGAGPGGEAPAKPAARPGAKRKAAGG